MVGDRGDLGIGMVGYAFMGRAHSQAWRTVGRFFDLPFTPAWPPSAAGTPPWSRPPPTGSAGPAWETDWKRLVERDDVDLVDVCTPGSSHAEISIAAWRPASTCCRAKPLANTVGEAGPWPRPRPGPPPASGDGRLQLPPGAGRRPGP